jgi:hypothetical protein
VDTIHLSGGIIEPVGGSGEKRVCDGYQEDLVWTLQRRGSSEPLETADGLSYRFSDEDEARVFLAQRRDAAELEVVAIHNLGTIEAIDR